jgi:uncharacterized membrane protein
MWEFLQGKKTYIVAILIGVLSAVYSLGWIDQQAYQTLLGLLTGGGLATLKNGQANQNPKRG